MNEKFWAGKRVFLTGHTGFKGSWLSIWLCQLDAVVSGFSLQPTTNPSLFELADIDSLMDSNFGDVRDAELLSQQILQFEPDIIIHMAAQPLVRESYTSPVQTFETNVMGTINVLESARGCSSVKAVVVVTTDKCYENKEWPWGYRENDSLGGHDPYSASKACAELVAQSWRLSFMSQSGEDNNQCAIATARAGNVIGGGDWADARLVPDVLRAISANKDVTLRNPSAIRPWQHVLEPLTGYLMLAERLYLEGDQWARAWNFGPNEIDAKSVSWIVDALIHKCESTSVWHQERESQPHEAQSLKLDCSLSRQLLAWSPVWSLDRCLDDIAWWQTGWCKKENVLALCKTTIENYKSDLSSS